MKLEVFDPTVKPEPKLQLKLDYCEAIGYREAPTICIVDSEGKILLNGRICEFIIDNNNKLVIRRNYFPAPNLVAYEKSDAIIKDVR